MRSLWLTVALVTCSCTFDYGTLKGKTSDGAAGARVTLSGGADVPVGAGGSTGGTLENDGAVASGGSLVTGGAIASGGSVGGGGATATGGSNGTGGMVATGGTVATGGRIGSGGTLATGGTIDTGGIVSSGGIVSTGGVVGTGGIVGSGGGALATGGTTAPASGGSAKTGGAMSSGGASTTGGTTGMSTMTLAQACAHNCALARGVTGCSTTEAVCEQNCMTTFDNTSAVNPDLGKLYTRMMVCVATDPAFSSSADFVCAKPNSPLNLWSPAGLDTVPSSKCEDDICGWNCSDATHGDMDPWVDIRCTCSTVH